MSLRIKRRAPRKSQEQELKARNREYRRRSDWIWQLRRQGEFAHRIFSRIFSFSDINPTVFNPFMLKMQNP